MTRKQSIWDDKKKWDEYRNVEYYNILGCGSVPILIKKRISTYKEGMFESPKSYDADGFAYNDGSWLIYNTCRITNGKFRNKILCKTKDDAISYLYDYICFLRKVGIVEKYELRYYSLCYIVNKLALHNDVFPKTNNNKNKINDLILSALKKSIEDIYCYRYDDRKFCMDAKIKKDKSAKEKSALRQVKKKEMNYEMILKLYDASKTYNQNLFNMKKQGLDICKNTLIKALKTQAK